VALAGGFVCTMDEISEYEYAEETLARLCFFSDSCLVLISVYKLRYIAEYGEPVLVVKEIIHGTAKSATS